MKISILRGNLSEMSYLAGLEVSTKGVDTSEADEKNDPVSVAKKQPLSITALQLSQVRWIQ